MEAEEKDEIKEPKPEDMEEEEIEEVDDAPKDESFMTFGKSFFTDSRLSAEEKKLIGNKRKRAIKKEKKLKRLPINIFEKKDKKRETSVFQEIFNNISKKTALTPVDIENEAKKLNYKLDAENISFFTELAAAKYSSRKIGLPTDFIKKKFHLYAKVPFVSDTILITNDFLAWKIYAAPLLMTTWKENFVAYTEAVKFASIKEISVVTNSVFQLKEAFTGYVQDYNDNYSILIKDKLKAEEVNEIINGLNTNKIVPSQIKTLDQSTYNYIDTSRVIIYCSPKLTLDKLRDILLNTECISSKNPLNAGLKKFKSSDKTGYYINIHDIKPVKFTPAVMYLNPRVKDLTYFVSGYLDSNETFNACQAAINNKTKFVIQLPLPPNAIFWDNVSSFIRILNLMLVTAHAMEKDMKENITQITELYFTYKDIYNAWKKTYYIFQSVVLKFYDSITNKVQIDTIIRLKNKANEFINAFSFLKNDSSYTEIVKLITSLPNPHLMQKFLQTNAALELMTSISKFIVVLESGKSLEKEGLSVVEMYKGIGILCFSVLFGEGFQMIPKIRSKAAFLAGSGKDLNEATYVKNIGYLINAFKLKREEDKKAALEKSKISFEDLDETISSAITNSIDLMLDVNLKDAEEDIKKQIRSDPTLYKILREEILELLKNGETKHDIMAVADFLEVPQFNSFIAAFGKLKEEVAKKAEKVDDAKLLKGIKLAPGSKRKRRIFKKPTKRKKKLRYSDLSTEASLIIEPKKILEAGEIKEEGSKAELEKAILDINEAFGLK